MSKQQARAISGIILLDKPLGLSSNQALQRVKRLFNARKAGHSGSLDPLATGMLPICLGEATKFSQVLLDADKHYRVTAQLGQTTTTGDAEGEVLSSAVVPDLTAEHLTQVLQSFQGTLQQLPPMYSALKHQGQPLYRLARQGKTIERAPRTITIYQLQLLDFTTASLSLDVVCSKGTYIRSLVEDIGSALGCGAYVSELRRLAAGPYQAEQMLSLTQLQAIFEQQGLQGLDQQLLAIDTPLSAWPSLSLTAAEARRVLQGQAVLAAAAPSTGLVRLVTAAGQFVGIGQIQDDGCVKPTRLISQIA